MRYAIIENNVVVNVILSDDETFVKDLDTLLLDEDSPVAPGFVKVNGAWKAPLLEEVITPTFEEKLATMETELAELKEKSAVLESDLAELKAANP